MQRARTKGRRVGHRGTKGRNKRRRVHNRAAKGGNRRRVHYRDAKCRKKRKERTTQELHIAKDLLVGRILCTI